MEILGQLQQAIKIWIGIIFFIPVLAYPAVGKITEQVNDPPSIKRKEQTLQGKKGSEIEMQDLLKTGQGKAQITFVDNTVIQMTESAKVLIDEFVYDPNQKDAGKLAIKIASGTARYASGQIAKNDPSKVKIKTPTATVSVRGTDFTATVDELGRSVIILLPSCPPGWSNVEEDCITGEIEIESLAGTVVMNQPFQATYVGASEMKPTNPVIVDLTEDMISKILIVGKPKEIEEEQKKTASINILDQNELDKNLLDNELEKQEKEFYTDKISQNLLDNAFLKNILDILNLQLQRQQARILSGTEQRGILPDYIPDQGVKATVDTINVELCMDTGVGDISCIQTPTSQSATVRQIQGAIDITNRINNEGTTTITTIQK